MKHVFILLLLFSAGLIAQDKPSPTEPLKPKLQALQLFSHDPAGRLLGTFGKTTLTAKEDLKDPGKIIYTDSLGNVYEQVIMLRRGDGTFASADNRLFLVLPGSNFTESRLQVLQGYLDLWTQLDAYLSAQSKLLNIQREVK
jgi:hypothetical protein